MHNINLTVFLKLSSICLISIVRYSIVVIGTVIAVACWTCDNVVVPNFVITKLQTTVAHNCHIKTKCSHQTQITHIKFKSLTANSNHSPPNQNHSQQIQIAHSKLQIVHIKYKTLDSKYNSLTANTNTVSVKGDCGLRIADCGPEVKCRLRIKCGLGVKCRKETAD